ncbi:DUF2634 domain-containing protein [Tissierella sp. MB52-C2]|uniref:DUF2634 domain-containing protein n=1 Tax=Tissierella sp. MB52-C2 TaxID=3070999 RepID=UPI00280BA086|nr:DUF2634 domain-containing protein [Tissierella sp. MB52-C2]WMM24040.1 DUF2634 domain-containing protein [Tissierella sp. MB52-C2]
MIPKIEDISIGQQIETVEEPTYTWKIKGNRIVGYTDEIEAMEQAIYLLLNIERYRHEIYDWNYGIELSDLLGKDKAYVYSEMKRRVKEALMNDDRITDVSGFIFENPERNTIHVRFTVHTIFGDIESSKEVNI